MTNQQHPITPPPELVREWRNSARTSDMHFCLEHIATQAARWGADQELEACCEWLDNTDVDDSQEAAKHLRAARRPKPTSLKEQALEELNKWREVISVPQLDIIRQALEKLND